jgi:hypothetical protein
MTTFVSGVTHRLENLAYLVDAEGRRLDGVHDLGPAIDVLDARLRRGSRHLEAPVHRFQLELLPGHETEVLAQPLRNDDAPRFVDGRSYGRILPS